MRKIVLLLVACALFAAGGVLRGLGWLMGERPAETAHVVPDTAPRHFHIQKHCAYCGRHHAPNGSCEGCGAPQGV